VNGNGNNKKKRRKLFIYGGIGLGIVLLIAIGVFAATRGGTRLTPPSWRRWRRGIWLRVWCNGEGDAHHQGGSEVEGQRHCEEAAGGLRRQC